MRNTSGCPISYGIKKLKKRRKKQSFGSSKIYMSMICSLLHADKQVIHPRIFRGFALLKDLNLLLLLIGLSCDNKPTIAEFAPRMLSNFDSLFPEQPPCFSTRKKVGKRSGEKEKNAKKLMQNTPNY